MALVGKRGTFNQAAASVKVTMDDLTQLLDVSDAPLSRRLAVKEVPNWNFSWTEEDLDMQTATVNAISAAGGANTTITVVDVTNIRPRDVLKKRGGTLMLEVASINVGSNQFTAVVRPGLGSTDEGLAVNDVLEVVGQMPIEGDDPQEARDTDITSRFNYTEIFQEACHVTGTEQAIEKFGMPEGVIGHQQMKKFKELVIRWERSMIHGVRYKSADNKQRMTGGFLYLLTANVLSTTKGTNGSGADSLIRQAFRKSFDVGGNPRVLVCSPSWREQISLLNPQKVQIQRGDETAGSRTNTFVTDFGEVELVTDRFLPATKALLLQEEYASQRPVSGRAWHYEPLAKTGDSEKGQVLGEYGLQVKNDKAHAVLTLTDLT